MAPLTIDSRQRPRDAQMTRSLRWLVTLSTLALACRSGDAGSCPADNCGTLVIASLAEPSTLNPAVAGDIEARDVHDLIFDKLADLGPSMTTAGDTGFAPRLAESWSREDDRTLVFRLRDARWHDGAPVRAQDVVFSYTAQTDPELNSPHAASLQPIAEIAIRDSLTVVVRFHEVYGAQLYDAVYHLRILPEHLLRDVPLETWPTATFSRAPVGTGPYRFVRWDAGERILLERNDGYWGPIASIPRVAYQVLGSHEPIVNAMVTENADAVNALMVGPFRDRLAAAPHLRAVSFSPPQYAFLAFNFRPPGEDRGQHPVLGDVAVRRALVTSVNRPEIVEAVMGPIGRPGKGPVTRLQWIWSEDLPEPAFDPEQARNDLARAGWTDADGDGIRDRDGQPLRVRITATTSPLQHQFGVLIADAWRRIGVDVELEELDPATHAARAEQGAFDALVSSWLHDLEPYAAVRQRWTAGGLDGANVSAYVNPEYERLITSAYREPDADRALDLWQQSLQIFAEDYPALFLFDMAPEVWIHERVQDSKLRSDSWLAFLATWRIDAANALERDLGVP